MQGVLIQNVEDRIDEVIDKMETTNVRMKKLLIQVSESSLTHCLNVHLRSVGVQTSYVSISSVL